MNTGSKAVTPNTTADMPTNVNAPHTPAESTRKDAIPTWARTFMEKMEALTISVQSNNMKIDQLDMRLQKLASPKMANSWEDNSPQIEIPKEPINDHLSFSNFVPSNDQYLRDMTNYENNEVRVDIPMFKEIDVPKEYLNEDMTISLPKTTQFINPTPRSNSTIRCFKCQKVGHVKTNCLKLVQVMDDSNPLTTNDSKKYIPVVS